MSHQNGAAGVFVRYAIGIERLLGVKILDHSKRSVQALQGTVPLPLDWEDVAQRCGL